MSKFYVFSPYDELEEFETLEEAKKHIHECCVDEEEGIHPEIESFMILQQTHEIVVVPIDEFDEDDFDAVGEFEIQFKEL
jgi:copper oxidase (laccase) domain-containing protein